LEEEVNLVATSSQFAWHRSAVERKDTGSGMRYAEIVGRSQRGKPSYLAKAGIVTRFVCFDKIETSTEVLALNFARTLTKPARRSF
jgi:hypothetical protein